MPNTFAYVMLAAWPVTALVMFRLMPLERALIWSILGAYLVLPPTAEIDLPRIPPLDKTSIPNLAAFAILTVILGKRVAITPGSPTAKLLLVLFIVSPFATILTNRAPFIVGDVTVPGLPISDAVAVVAKQAIFLIPFFIARRYLVTEAAQREILIALVVAALIYSVPILLELRLSPRMNIWVYGFFQADFFQQLRFGGYRPIMFLQHGIWLAFFVLTAVIAALALCRSEAPMRAIYTIAATYLIILLILCKTVGAILYTVLLLPLLLAAGARTQIKIAALLALIVIAYPLLRGAGLVPVDSLLEMAGAIQEQRAESLQFRLETEEEILAHASGQPIFGWGGWGRNVVRDPITGLTDTVMDGRWLIVISVFGWAGYLAEFGLLALPLFLLARRARRRETSELSPYAGPLALLLGINIFDLLPNATLTPFTWLVAGALLGYAEEARSVRTDIPAKSQPAIQTVL